MAVPQVGQVIRASDIPNMITDTVNEALANDIPDMVADAVTEALTNDVTDDINNRLYEGVDLTVKFADEISEFDNDPWAWIKDRINYANYDGLHIADYIPFTTTDGYEFEAQIAGIDTYYETNYPAITYHHIDFITKDCHPTIIQWNTSNNNNGTSSNRNPWKASRVCGWLNNTVYNTLPENLKNKIVSKDWLLEYRYSTSGALTDSNTWEWGTLGKLWLPTETEVYGTCVWGTKGYSVGTSIQYPLFANRGKIKHAGKDGERCYW